MTLLCAGPILYKLGFDLYSMTKDIQPERKMSDRIIELKDTATVAGIQLPAGSKIYFSSDAFVPLTPVRIDHNYVDIIVFSKPTRAGNLLLRDAFTNKHDMYHTWQGTLEGIQEIKGWPSSGQITVSDKGQELQLAKEVDRWGLTIPAGTTVKLNPSSWEFSIPGGRTFTVYESIDGFFKQEGDSTVVLKGT